MERSVVGMNRTQIKEISIDKRLWIYSLSLAAFLVSGCATATRATWLGIGTGAAVGATSGALLDHQHPGEGALYSALAMGLIGGVAGYFTHESLEERDAQTRKETLFNLEKFGVSGFNSNPTSLDETNASGDKQKVLIITNDPAWTKNNKKKERDN
jgi:hypothetical protein